MPKIIISTVGTSQVTAWKRLNAGKDPTLDDLKIALQENSQISAEANSLDKIELDRKTDHLYFLASDSGEGQLCAGALRDSFVEKGYLYSFDIAIKGLTRNYHDFQTRGLSNLINELASIYERHFGAEIIINATGGYKAQTAVATMFGTIMGCEVVYLYEDFKTLIRFPPIPLSFKRSLILENSEIFNKILNADSLKEARQQIDLLPKTLQGFFMKTDQLYDFSPTGRIFMMAHAHESKRNDCVIRTLKSHSSLWGDGINDFGRIHDPDVRIIFKRIFDNCPAVTAIFLDEMQALHAEKTFLEFIEKLPGALRYRVRTPNGSEYIKIEVLPGYEQTTLERLGKLIYP